MVDNATNTYMIVWHHNFAVQACYAIEGQNYYVPDPFYTLWFGAFLI